MKAAMLIVPLAVSLLMGPLAAEAQPRGNLPRVGVLDPGSPQRHADCLSAFQQGLRDQGYVEGQDVRFEYRLPRHPPSTARSRGACASGGLLDCWA